MKKPFVRPAAVAGQFYPDRPDRLRAAVDGYITSGRGERAGAAATKAVIAPHAGYVYSGPVAGSAYRRVAACGVTPERVVLAGPAHRAPVRSVVTTSALALRTPLGEVPVDAEARDIALALDGVGVDDAAHAPEHSLEVHLPFLQFLYGAVPVLPLCVGPHGAAVLAAVLDVLWGGAETLIVVSTDLSHYHDQPTATRLDARTANAITRREHESLEPTDACGCWAVHGLLRAAVEHELDVERLDLRTSADTAGSADRVVGYGSFALAPPA